MRWITVDVVESFTAINFAGPPHGGLWFDMVESKELRVFYLLLFFPATGFRPRRIEYGFPDTLE